MTDERRRSRNKHVPAGVLVGVVAALILTPVNPALGAGPIGPGGDNLEVTTFPVAGSYDLGTAENAYGNNRGSHIHEGQDVFAKPGTPVVAVRDSEVLEAGSDGGRGNYVYLYSSEEDETYGYFHMDSAPKVAKGDEVRAGQALGGVGCTGSCWGDHLHFEVHRGRDAYEGSTDPLPLLKELGG